MSKLMRGFSLLEMMITLVVLSVGLLGVAALQSRGQQFNHAAYIRTQAAILGYDILERIRMNANFALVDLPATGVGAAGQGYVAVEAPASPPDCELSVCTPTQLRSYDLAQWYAQINARLPMTNANEDGTVTLSAANSSSIVAKARDDVNDPCPNVGYMINIRWGQREGVELDANGDPIDKSIQMEMCL